MSLSFKFCKDFSSSIFVLIIIFRNLLSDKQKKRFENPTFIGLTRLSRMNTIWGNHLHISNGGLLLANISHMFICTSDVDIFFWYSFALSDYLMFFCLSSGLLICSFVVNLFIWSSVHLSIICLSQVHLIIGLDWIAC